MTRGGGKRAAIGVALLLIALAGIAALTSLDSRGIAAAQATTDYDDDNDGLIDVTTLAQLNAIRWDLNGDGNVSATDAANYLLAFPNRDTNAATRMGCPSGACTGYELRADLDFDTDDDGDVDASDSPSFPNWTPIGPYTAPYTAEFKGNNRAISNLTITTHQSYYRLGLFGTLSSTAVVTGVGMLDANINVPAAQSSSHAGALVGYNEGIIRSSYSTGSVSAAAPAPGVLNVGGLAGSNVGGAIAASWSSADVSTTSGEPRGGGLLGHIDYESTISRGSIIASYATGTVTVTGGASIAARGGGLVGDVFGNASVTASYAAGPVSVSGTTTHVGGLYGERSATSTITASYWDTNMTGIADDNDADMPEGRTARQLQQARPYSGIYSAWNVNVDGVAGNDDPWAFGTGMQYPMLKWDGMSLPAQSSLAMGAPDVDTNGETPTVGRMARVCLTTGPVLRAPRTGSPSLPARWVWQRSADLVTWTNIADDGGGTYEYTPVAADANNHLRACVAIRSTDARTRGESMACTRPFPQTQSN